MVYRASSENGPFQLLTPSPIAENTFQDMTVSNGQNVVYQVRTAMLRETKSGSFYEVSAPNTSEKVIVSVHEEKVYESTIACSPQPMSYSGIIQFVAPHAVHADVTIHSLDGRTIKSLLKSRIDGGGHSIMVPAHELPIGMYIVRVILDGKSLTAPLIISR
jgi:hypothetical protein